jgi:hypothetical protein
MATASPLVNKFNHLLDVLAARRGEEFLTLRTELRDFLWDHDPGRADRPPFYLVLYITDGVMEYEVTPSTERLQEIAAEYTEEEEDGADYDTYVLTLRSVAPVVVSHEQNIYDYLPGED